MKALFSTAPRCSELAQRAAVNADIFLPHMEPGWIGATIAVGGAAFGEWWAILSKAGQQSSAQASLLGWIALSLVVGGMIIQITQVRVRGGWQVNFAERHLQPQGLRGQAQDLDDSGYAVACVAGSKFRSVAIDLRHAERGTVARLFQSPPRVSLKDIRAVSELTDHLAQRLRIGREGMAV